MNKAILTCALTGVLTNPKQHPVPVTPAQMAAEARDAFNAGASIMHVHIRRQEEGLGYLPSWDPDIAEQVVDEIRSACPGVIINLSTGVLGHDISGPVACIRRVKPEIAACNAGSLNYLKIKEMYNVDILNWKIDNERSPVFNYHLSKILEEINIIDRLKNID